MKNLKKISIVLSIILISLIFLSTISASDISLNDTDINQDTLSDIQRNTDNDDNLNICDDFEINTKEGSAESVSSADEISDSSSDDINSDLMDGEFGYDNVNPDADSDLEISNLKSVLGAGSTKTFTQLAQEIADSGSVLYLSDNYKYDYSTDSAYLGGIYVNKNLTIYGPATIDGNSHARIFIVGANVKLININFTGAFHATQGGVAQIVQNASLSAVNCSFSSNSAGEFGGVFLVYNGNLNLNQCNFDNNCARYILPNYYASAGVIYTYGNSTVNITASNFTNNYAYNRTGVIFFSDETNATIKNSYFARNKIVSTNSWDIGVIEWRGNNGKLLNSVFENNSGVDAGAILWLGKDGVIDNCSFRNNYGRFHAGAIYYLGDGQLNSTLNITNSNFYNNSADFGGALLIENAINVNNCSFIRNKANYGGGGAIELSYDSNASWRLQLYGYKIDSCIFLENYAYSPGPAISIGAGVGYAHNCIFIDNEGGYSRTPVVISESARLPDLNYNWWGSTADDYDQVPISTNKYLSLNNWYYLNMTNQTYHDLIDITLNNLFDNSTKEISTYDYCSFYPINFTTVSEGIVTPQEPQLGRDGISTVSFVFGSDFSYLTVCYHSVNLTRNIEEIPSVPYLYFNYSNIFYGEDAKIDILLENVDPDTNGTAVLTISGNNYNVSIKNARGSKILSDLSTGRHDFNASFTNSKYGTLTRQRSLVVFPCSQMDMIIDVDDIDYADDLIIDARLNTSLNNSGSASLVIYNAFNRVVAQYDNLNVNNSRIHKVIPNLFNAGSYYVKAVFNGNSNISSANGSADFVINPITPMLTVSAEDIDYTSYATVYANMTSQKGLKLNGTVSFSLNQKTYSIYVTNGEGYVRVYNLTGGDYTIDAIFNKNTNLLGVNDTCTFTVNPINASLSLTIKNIYGKTNLNYGQDAILNISLYYGNLYYMPLTDNVNLTIDGNDYGTVYISGGIGIKSIPLLDAGAHNVTVIFEGNRNFNPASCNETFNITPTDSLLDVHINNTNYGNDVKIIVKLTGYNNTGINGTVIVNVNGTNYTVNIVKGTGTRSVSGLDAGYYDNVTAVYEASNNYKNSSDYCTFSVKPISPSLGISAKSPIVYGDDAVINISLKNGSIKLNGTVILNVNGSYYAVNVADGTGSISISGLSVGTYRIIATSVSSGNYKEASATYTLTVNNVSRVTPKLSVSIDDIDFGEDAVINVNLNGLDDAGLTGSVSVNISNRTYNVDVVNGVGAGTVSGLDVGYYDDVLVKFNANSIFYGANASTSFNVRPISPTVELSIEDIDFGEDAILRIRLNGLNGVKLDGIVLVDINGSYYAVDVVNGLAAKSVSSLNAGSYNAVARFVSKGNYKEADDEESFAVRPISPDLGISAEDIVYGNNATIKINLTGLNDVKLNGTVNITAANKKYSVDVTNGMGVLTISNLTVGNYTNVTASFIAKGNYAKINKTTSFAVKPADPSLIVSVEDIDYGQSAKVNVKFTGVDNVNLTGSVMVSVNGTSYQISVNGGQGSETVSGLNAGIYDVTAASSPVANYNEATSFVSFTVRAANLSLSVTVDDINYKEDAIIKVKLNGLNNAQLSGTVIVNICDTDYEVDVVNGAGTKSISSLAGGDYTASARFAAFGNYGDAFSEDTFKVNPIDGLNISVNVEDIDFGKQAVVEINLSGSDNEPLSGNVSYKILNGVAEIYNGTLTVNNGIGHGRISALLPMDTYTIVASFSDDNYLMKSAADSFNVSKSIGLSALVEEENIRYGENATIKIIFYDDDVPESAFVDIYLNGEFFSTAELTNGEGNMTIPHLNVGNYTIFVSYGTYESWVIFNVSKAIPDINVSAEEITEGEVLSMNVNLTGTDNAPLDGVVIININSKDYGLNIFNGESSFSVEGLSAKDYPVSVRYVGDDNYESVIRYLNILVKNDTTPSLGMDAESSKANSSDISIYLMDYEGNPLSGEVTLKIDDGDEVNVDVANGYRLYSISNISGGPHHFEISYNDGIHDLIVISKDLNVLMPASYLDINANDHYAGEAVSVEVYATDSAKNPIGGGKYVICLDGNLIDTPVVNNQIVLNNLDIGLHTIDVSYENEDYLPSSSSCAFNVKAMPSTVNADISDSRYGEKVPVSIYVEDVNNNPVNGGNFTIYLDGDVIKPAIKNNEFNLTDWESGRHSIQILFNKKGYESSVFNKVFMISRSNDASLVISSKDIAHNESALINITLNGIDNSLIDGIAVINVDGRDYSVNVTNGKGSLSISGLKPGTYLVQSRFAGNENYYEKTGGTSSFTVRAVPVASLTLTAGDIMFGENLTLNVKAVNESSKSISGSYSFAVDGVSKSYSVSDGKVIISGLSAGKHFIQVTFRNDTYGILNESLIVSVNKSTNANITLSAKDISHNESADITVSVKGVNNENLHGVAVVTVDGMNYAVNVTSGKGSLSIGNLGSGTYAVNAIFTGNDNYAQANAKSVSFAVKAVPVANLTISANDIRFGENLTLNVKAVNESSDIIGGSYSFAVDGVSKSYSVSNGKVIISGLSAGKHFIQVTFRNDTYGVLESGIIVTVDNPVANMTLSASDIRFGETLTLNVKVVNESSKSISGSYSFAVDGVSKSYSVSNGKVIISGLEAGNHLIEVTFRNDTYGILKESIVVSVSKSDNVNLTVNGNDIMIGDTVQISITLKGNNNANIAGVVIVTVDEVDYAVNVSSGKGSLAISDLGANSYAVDARFIGNDNYQSAKASTSFKVKDYVPVSLNVTGDILSANVTAMSGKNKLNITVNLTIDGKTHQLKISDGQAIKADLSAGRHIITLSYIGNGTYSPANITKEIMVEKGDGTALTISTKSSIKYGESAIVNLTLFNGASDGLVALNINGTDYLANVTNGFASVNINNLAVGKYMVYAEFLGNDNYIGTNASASLSVNKYAKTILEVTPIEEAIIVTLKDEDGNAVMGSVNVTIDGQTRKYYLAKGNYTISASPGNRNVTVSYGGDSTNKPSKISKTVNVPIEIINTAVTVKVNDIKYGDKAVINFTLRDIRGNNLNATLNVTVGELIKSVNITNGVASLSLSNLTAGNYPVVANYTGTKKYGSSVGTSFFNVAKNATMIIFSDMNTTAVDPKNDGRTGEYFYFTLKDANGNIMPNTPMQIGFNGKVYTYEKDGVCTNEKGVARLQINLGYKGDYTFAVCFLGDENHNASFVVAKIKVACQKPNLNVPNKYYKVSDKTKTLTATFKNEHGNLIAGQSVKFTIDGKTYSAKTNDKGVATVKVSLNKKGTYSFVASYGGSSTYSEVTKTATLIIS